LIVGQRSQFVVSDDSALSRPAPDDRRIDAAAIVNDLDDKPVTRARRPHRDGRAFGLSRGAALLRTFNAVIERIAHKMQQRLEQAIDNGLIGLRRLSVGHEPDFLPEPLRHVAHEPGKRPKDLCEWHHPELQDGGVHFTREPFDRIVFTPDCPRKFAVLELVLQSPREMRDAVLGDYQLPRQINQCIDLPLVHAKGAARRALYLLHLRIRRS
jgi:hypothetical protein